jgi:hypothetical protein
LNSILDPVFEHAEAVVKITGFSDAPPVAVTVYVVPTSPGLGGLDVMLITCDFLTANDC